MEEYITSSTSSSSYSAMQTTPSYAEAELADTLRQKELEDTIMSSTQPFEKLEESITTSSSYTAMQSTPSNADTDLADNGTDDYYTPQNDSTDTGNITTE